MKISTRVQYATRALLDMAVNQDEKPVQLKDIAGRQQISLPYLEHITNRLANAGIIRSVRGPRGGVSLARSPENIKISEIMRAIEGPMSLVKCLGSTDDCSRSGACVTQNIWSDVQKAIEDVLESTTLKDLVERQKEMTRSPATMYNI